MDMEIAMNNVHVKTENITIPNSCIYISPIGNLRICEKSGAITNLYLEKGEPETVISRKYEKHSDLLYEAYRQLREYFLGHRIRFDLPVNCQGTRFQQKVWKELQNIPYGETRSYEDIATGIGNKKAVRAVGQANNKNPVMIVVPCHRVIHKNGSLGGFGCGVEIKQYLLELERRNTSF